MRRFLAVIFILFVGFAQLMTIFLVVRPLTVPTWYVDVPHNSRRVTDFFQYVQVAQMGVARRHDVYDPQAQLAWHNDLIKPLKWGRCVEDVGLKGTIFYNQQPPSSYFLLLPLAFVPYGVGYFLWCVLQSAAGLTALYFLSSFGPLSSRDRKVFLLAVACSAPAYLCLWQGNTSYWLCACLGFYAYFWLKGKGKDIWGGIFLALSTFKPQYTLMLSLPSVVAGRWLLILAAAVTEILLLIAGGSVIGFENVINYKNVIATAESNPDFIGVRPAAMVSLRGVFSHLGMSIQDSLFISSSIMILSLVPLCWVLFRLHRQTKMAPNPEITRWAMAMTMVFALSLSPHSHVFDCVLLAIPAALTLNTLSLVDALEIKPLSLRVWSTTFIIYPITGWLLNFPLDLMLNSREHLISPMFFFLINVVLLASGCAYLFHLWKEQQPKASQIIDATIVPDSD